MCEFCSNLISKSKELLVASQISKIATCMCNILCFAVDDLFVIIGPSKCDKTHVFGSDYEFWLSVCQFVFMSTNPLWQNLFHDNCQDCIMTYCW